MKRTLFLTAIGLLYALFVFSQKNEISYEAHLARLDSVEIPFTFTAPRFGTKNYYWTIHNGKEQIRVQKFEKVGDSIRVIMPLFESQFIVKQQNGIFKGRWIKGGSLADQIMYFTAVPTVRKQQTKTTADLNGKWAVSFINFSGEKSPAVGEFVQKGAQLSGTFLTTTGDYRYLQGSVHSDSFSLSTFDGGHAFLFTGKIAQGIKDGMFYSGLNFKERWEAVKDPNATIPEDASAVYLRKGEETIHFAFPDLSGKIVKSTDPRFDNKVVVVQIMGSWCPNCMDETAFLSAFYDRYKKRGVEVVSLAYELTENRERSVKSLSKFQTRFNVQYPMLITSASVNDSLRTEKTLPQLTPIKMFPTTIILGKDRKVKKIDTGFVGPGTGSYYEQYRKEFLATIEELLQQ